MPTSTIATPSTSKLTPTSTSTATFLGMSKNPGQKLLGPRVDSGRVFPGAALTPAHHPDDGGPGGAPPHPLPQWTPRVPGAGILSVRITHLPFGRLGLNILS